MTHDARPDRRVIAAFVLAAATAAGQDPALPDDIAALAPHFAEMRLGSWDAGRTERAVRQLLAAGWIEAAGWWLTDAEKALKAGGLPPAIRGTLASLRETWKLRLAADSFARELGQDMSKHLRAVVAAKNLLAAREFAGVIGRHLALFPDAETQGVLERVRKDLPQGTGAADGKPAVAAAQRETSLELAERSLQLAGDYFDRALDQYRGAGSRTGRHRIADLSKAFHGPTPPAAAAERLKTLRRIARELEPARPLEVTIGFWLPYTASLDGAPLVPVERTAVAGGTTITRFQVSVLDGDRVELVYDRGQGLQSRHALGPSADVPDEMAAVAVRLADAELPPARWRLAAAGAASDRPAVIGRKGVLTEKEKQAFPGDRDRPGELPAVIFDFPPDWHRFIVTVPEVATEAAMTERGLVPRWTGIWLAEPVLVLVVP